MYMYTDELTSFKIISVHLIIEVNSAYVCKGYQVMVLKEVNGLEKSLLKWSWKKPIIR